MRRNIVEKMLANAPDQQKVALLYYVRNAKEGWTMDQRKAFFGAVAEARGWSGGDSYQKFLNQFEKDAFEWFEQVPIGVVTHGPAGAVLFVNGERYGVEPDVAVEKDETGAGDVFAAALLIAYNRDGNAWDAAALAACCAAASVEAEGAAGVPDRTGLEARLTAYRRRLGI